MAAIRTCGAEAVDGGLVEEHGRIRSFNIGEVSVVSCVMFPVCKFPVWRNSRISH